MLADLVVFAATEAVVLATALVFSGADVADDDQEDVPFEATVEQAEIRGGQGQASH